MKKALVKMFVLCYGSVLISGCATTGGKALYYNEAVKAPDIVAILPPENETTDINATDTFRRVMATVMVALGYLPVASPSQEDSLQQMGISDGGQLKIFKPRDISQKLGSDGLLYGNVSEFNDLNVGLYRERRVDFSGYLTNTSGAKAWESEGRSVGRKFSLSLDAVTQSFVEGLAQKMVERILNIHLLEEASVAGVFMMQKIPEWPEVEKLKANAIKRDKPQNSTAGLGINQTAAESDETPAFSALPAAIAAKNDETPAVSTAPAEVAIEKESVAPKIAGWIAQLKSQDWQQRRTAAFELGKVKAAEAVEPLMELLDDENDKVCGVAAMALGRIGDKRAFSPLVERLEDESVYVRASAAKALSYLGDKRAIKPLNSALKDRSAQVRKAAGQAVKSLSRKGKRIPSKKPAITP